MALYFTNGGIAKDRLSRPSAADATRRRELKAVARTKSGIMLFDQHQAHEFIESRAPCSRIKRKCSLKFPLAFVIH
jgi:hypothetical protein